MVAVEFLDFFAKLTIAFVLIRAAQIFGRNSWVGADLGALFGGVTVG